ncbi:cell death activator CIDE-B isoform X2 [Rhinatrema bivittatum]|uniref:cell death activator CIDE-B isoform X2 n=1 Tax=Rhinatrema bivittatum TaxID=194408 RepID=UPI00112CC79B|nr:cell death activator CIDE-B isoform X2 [Rhinatrema bivittatum]
MKQDGISEVLGSIHLSPLPRSVSSVSSQLTKRVWSSSPPPQKPFRICNHDRSTRKGVTAGTLRELIAKAMDAMLITGIISLVLEEDGTLVDNEDFFEMIDDNTAFMILEKGQKWSSVKSRVLSYSLNSDKPRNSKDIARITFDIYKLNPRDLFGSLNIKATFYGLYSMSCDFRCLGPKKFLREILRLLSSMMQGVGHLLLTTSNYLRRVIEGPDHWHPARITVYKD